MDGLWNVLPITHLEVFLKREGVQETLVLRDLEKNIGQYCDTLMKVVHYFNRHSTSLISSRFARDKTTLKSF